MFRLAILRRKRRRIAHPSSVRQYERCAEDSRSSTGGAPIARAEPVLTTPRLVLEPLVPSHTDVLFGVLDDPDLHTFTGGQPRTRDELARWIGAVAAGGPPDGGERWCNWVVRRRDDDEVVGTVQATIVGEEASIAWVTGSAFQGSGFAKEAAAAMAEWLRSQGGVTKLRAEINPDHLPSQAVARSLGLAPTDELDDGEVVWRDVPPDP